MDRLAAVLLDQLLAEIPQDGVRLTLVRRRGDNKVVGDERHTADIEQNDLAGQFLACQVHDTFGEIKRFEAVRCGSGLAGASLQRRWMIEYAVRFLEISRGIGRQVASQAPSSVGSSYPATIAVGVPANPRQTR